MLSSSHSDIRRFQHRRQSHSALSLRNLTLRPFNHTAVINKSLWHDNQSIWLLSTRSGAEGQLAHVHTQSQFMLSIYKWRKHVPWNYQSDSGESERVDIHFIEPIESFVNGKYARSVIQQLCNNCKFNNLVLEISERVFGLWKGSLSSTQEWIILGLWFMLISLSHPRHSLSPFIGRYSCIHEGKIYFRKRKFGFFSSFFLLARLYKPSSNTLKSNLPWHSI